MKELILGGQALVIGYGCLKALERERASRAFIVTGGSSMQKSGVISRIETMLAGRGISSRLYSGVAPNPDTRTVVEGVEAMREFAPDLVVAVGGGSAIDAAKVMALFYEYPELDFAAAASGELPQVRSKVRFIAIPSTSGTGTEVTRAAVITYTEQNIKIGLKSAAFVPDVAILDAELTMTMPARVVAETGMDALTHAVECYINRSLDDFTEPLARGAAAGIFEYLPVSYQEGTRESREKVHHYQAMAGMAFSNVGLGMAHGIAHAVGGRFGLGHGLINAIALPYVLEYNAADEWVRSQLGRLARSIGAKDFIAAVAGLNRTLAIPASFQAAGLPQDAFEASLAELAADSLQGSTRVNPVPVAVGAMTDLLRRMYRGA